MSVVFVFEHLLYILHGHVRVEPAFNILDFFGSDRIIIICTRVINESFIEQSVQEEIEIGENTSMETQFILLEDCHDSVIDFSFLLVALGLRDKLSEELKHTEEGDTIYR